MSIAPRLTKCLMLSTICAGHERLGQRTATSPSSRTTTRAAGRAVLGHAPRAGRASWAADALPRPPRERRPDDLRDDVAGALDDHVVAGRGCPCGGCRPRCAAWRRSTVTPPTCTGSSTANGVSTPVRPTLTSMLCSRVIAVVGANLKAIAQRGSWATSPRARCSGVLVHLDDHAVDVVVERGAAIRPGARTRRRPARSCRAAPRPGSRASPARAASRATASGSASSRPSL